jgi:hypothetical protein
MIPTSSKWVRLQELHPKMKYRLEKFFADPRIKGKVVVSSGVRTYAQQKDLYRRYKAGTFPNLVANPDRKFGGGFQGSWHMQQPSHPEGNYGFAVDFRIVGKISTGDVNKVAKEYGLERTVPSEWWHHQAYGYRYDTKKYDWYDAPALSSDDEKKAEVGATVLAKTQNRGAFAEIASAMKTTVRKGAKGPAVKLMQSRLANLGYRLTKYPSARTGIDGHFGWYTLRALKQFQKKKGLVADGICGPITWKALMSNG